MSKNTDSISPELEAKIIQAIEDSDIPALKALLKTGFPLDAPLKSAKGETALALARLRSRKVEPAILLLEAGADWRKARMDLVYAVYYRNEHLVRMLIERGADVNFKAPRSMGPPLRLASAWGLRTIADMLIAAGADLNDGALASAVENNHTDMIKRLLEAGAQPGKEGAGGAKMLTTAIEKGNEEVAELLIKAGAGKGLDLNERSTIHVWNKDHTDYKPLMHYATPLMFAAAQGRKRVVEALVAAGADVHLVDKEGSSARAWADKRGHGDVAAFLQTAEGRQAKRADPSLDLLYAAEKGETDRLREALKSGARVDARDVRPGAAAFTPLMLAARAGHLDAVQALLDAGADVNARDDQEESSASGFSFVVSEMGPEGAIEAGFQLHRTALHWAAAGGHAPIVEALLKRRPQVDLPDRAKLTPLMLAAGKGSAPAVEALLAAGADAAIKGRRKQAAIHLAAESGNAEVIRRLIAAGADPKAKDGEGDTPLILAARGARADAVEALLAAGVDPRAVNRGQENALHQVCGHRLYDNKLVSGKGVMMVLRRPEEQMLRTVRLLVAAGVDPHAGDKHNFTPMGGAERGLKGHPFYAQIIAALKEAPPPTPDAPAKKPPAPRKPRPRKVQEPAPAPDFSHAAGDPGYQKLLGELESLFGSTRQPMDRTEGGFIFYPHSSKRDAIEFDKLQNRLLKEEAFLFYMGTDNSVPIGVLPTRDPCDALLAMQTNGINCDVMPQDIIAWLKETAAENPFRITGVGHDFVEGRFTGKVKKATALARRISNLCPDGDGEVEGLAEDLKTSGKLFLWWD